MIIISSDRLSFTVKKWAYFREPKHSRMNWLVNDSAEWNKYQLQLIRNSDIKNERRPAGEVPKFKEVSINWEIVPKVNETIVRELQQDDDYVPMTNQQQRVIAAKVKGLLGKDNPGHIEELCQAKIGKSFTELNKNEAKKIIRHLESEEQVKQMDEKRKMQAEPVADSE